MSEPLEDRLARERAERIALKELGEMARKSTQPNAARPTNPRRYEAAKRTYTELKEQALAARKVKPSPAPEPAASGEPTEFYVWKAGEVGKINILTQGEFTAI